MPLKKAMHMLRHGILPVEVQLCISAIQGKNPGKMKEGDFATKKAGENPLLYNIYIQAVTF